jgi:uncharacterized membrane protein
MSDERSRTSRGGGILVALAVVIGAVAGLALRQPQIGMIAGLATGLVLAALVWLLDRR